MIVFVSQTKLPDSSNPLSDIVGAVHYVRIDWENSRHKKNARSVIYKGLNWYMGIIGERWGN